MEDSNVEKILEKASKKEKSWGENTWKKFWNIYWWQADPLFWKIFIKIGKIDVLLDDGGHKNIQQITSFMESVKFSKPGGKIVVEDNYASYMKKKGFKIHQNTLL